MAICTRTALAGVIAIVAGRAPAHAASCVPGFDYAAFARNSLTFSGNGATNSYDSSVGTYTATVTNAGGDIGTDGTGAGVVSLGGNAAIHGNVAVGAGATVSTAITKTSNATYGSGSALANTLALPSVSVPAVGGNQGNKSFSGGNNTLLPNQTYGNVSCSGGPSTRLTLSTGTYVMSSLTVSGQCTIAVGSGPIVVYITSSMTLAGGSVSNPALRATDLMFLAGPGVAGISITGGSDASFALYAPDTAVAITGNGDIFGAVVGKTVTASGNGAIHYDHALASATAGTFTCSKTEISRASPVIAAISNTQAIVQGTFETPSGTQRTIATIGDVASFTFPYIKGHMRARTIGSVTSVASTFASGTILFDAATAIPAASYGGCGTYTGACRHVFTTTVPPDATGRAYLPPIVTLDDTTASTIGALIAPASTVTGIGAAQWQSIVHAVLSASLGGVDRSTVAIVGPSANAGAANRPTIAYFGATDGMLHAVCASVGNGCPALGTELWAFLPRVQLPLVRTNTARIDGSPRVLDVFWGGGWHTILDFQTGFAINATPALYAIDITNPTSPSILWEYARPAAPAATDFGTGLGVDAGVAVRGSLTSNLVYAATNNGGTDGAGIVVTAFQQETGARLWQFAYTYPSPPRGVASDAPLPALGIPGRVTTVDMNGQGLVTDVVFGDLYGDLWRLNAMTGEPTTGTGPLFRFTTNKHPIGVAPTIYKNNNRWYAAFASGGYDDPVSTSWSASDQYLVAVNLSPVSAPVTEAATACATCDLAVKQALSAGDKGFAQTLVVGTQLFQATDATDVSTQAYAGANTGHLVGIDLTGATAATSIVIGAGAGMIGANGATLYGSSGQYQQQVATANGSIGDDVNLYAVAAVIRAIWLRLE